MRPQFHEKMTEGGSRTACRAHLCCAGKGTANAGQCPLSAPSGALPALAAAVLRLPRWEGSAAKPRLTPLGLAFSKRTTRPWKAPPHPQNIY